MKDIGQYMGIVGTVTGTTLGFLLSSIKEYFKNKGKIYYDFSDTKLIRESIKNRDYRSVLRIINYSNQTKILKDIKMTFVLDNNDKFDIIPNKLNSSNEFQEIILLTLKPYQAQEINFDISINKDNIHKEITFKNIVFKAKNVKGKNIKVILK